jgi:hypothetical protein
MCRSTDFAATLGSQAGQLREFWICDKLCRWGQKRHKLV